MDRGGVVGGGEVLGVVGVVEEVGGDQELGVIPKNFLGCHVRQTVSVVTPPTFILSGWFIINGSLIHLSQPQSIFMLFQKWKTKTNFCQYIRWIWGLRHLDGRNQTDHKVN